MLWPVGHWFRCLKSLISSLTNRWFLVWNQWFWEIRNHWFSCSKSMISRLKSMISWDAKSLILWPAGNWFRCLKSLISQLWNRGFRVWNRWFWRAFCERGVIDFDRVLIIDFFLLKSLIFLLKSMFLKRLENHWFCFKIIDFVLLNQWFWYLKSMILISKINDDIS